MDGNRNDLSPEEGCDTVLFAYVDESGDTGLIRSPSTHYALGSLLLSNGDWLNALDAIITFRRYLRTTYGISMAAELKAQYLLRGHASLGPLTPIQRMAVYSTTMQFIATSSWARVFAVVVDKNKIVNRADKKIVFRNAWNYSFQRYQSWAESRDTRIMVLHDDGNNAQVRKRLRAIRRFHHVPSFFNPGQTLEARAYRIVEDSTPRDSKASYFVQLADLAAYAAIRVLAPTKSMGASQCNLLGPTRIEEVSKLSGGPHGIVKWPK